MFCWLKSYFGLVCLVFWCTTAFQISLQGNWKKVNVNEITLLLNPFFNVCNTYFFVLQDLWSFNITISLLCLAFYQHVLFAHQIFLLRWKPVAQKEDQQRPLCLVFKACLQDKTFQQNLRRLQCATWNCVSLQCFQASKHGQLLVRFQKQMAPLYIQLFIFLNCFWVTLWNWTFLKTKKLNK